MQHATQSIIELERRAAPAGRPQPLALYAGLLWTGSWENRRLYGIDPKTWTVHEDVAAPGTAYGLAPLGDVLHVVVSDDGEADDRFMYRFTRAAGFDESSKTPCPDMTGSHLSSDGRQLFLGQMHNRRIVALDDRTRITKEIALPTRCGGFGFGPEGTLYMISADEEFERLTLARLDFGGTMTPLAPIPFGARSLVYDGKAWYTSDREAGQIVRFRL